MSLQARLERWSYLSPLTSDMELQDLEVGPAVFWPCIGAVLTQYTLSPQFWNGTIYSVPLYAGRMELAFDFTESSIKRLP